MMAEKTTLHEIGMLRNINNNTTKSTHNNSNKSNNSSNINSNDTINIDNSVNNNSSSINNNNNSSINNNSSTNNIDSNTNNDHIISAIVQQILHIFNVDAIYYAVVDDVSNNFALISPIIIAFLQRMYAFIFAYVYI